MEKEITLKEFAGELRARLKEGKSIDCCSNELIKLSYIVEKKLPNATIFVTWKD